jgi:hypothetical protein
MSITRREVLLCLLLCGSPMSAAAQSVEEFMRLADEMSRTNVDPVSAAEITVSMELCAARPGFKAATAPNYTIWKQNHRVVLALVPQLLNSAKNATPVDDTTLSKKCVRLQRYFSRTHPDPLFATPEKTWEHFLDALRSGDREAALDCLVEPALSNQSDIIEGQSIELLHKLGTGYEPLRPLVTSGDKVTRTVTRNGQVGQVFFVRIDQEWRIAEP